MRKIAVLGAGLAGLFAANYVYKNMRDVDLTIIEKQPKLPNNHTAVLRFRTEKFAKAVNINFKQVHVVKDYDGRMNGMPPLEAALSYSFKCTGEARTDRSILDCPSIVTRYIAPYDLQVRLAKGIAIHFDYDISADQFDPHDYDAIISTIPMPFMMKYLSYPKEDILNAFSSTAGTNIRAKMNNVHAYATMYDPTPGLVRRASLHQDELIVECGQCDGLDVEGAKRIAKSAANMFGLTQQVASVFDISNMRMSKILPIADTERYDFMMWATDNFNLFSLGRYATWRPGLLLDDLPKDMDKIIGWIEQKHRIRVAR